MDFAKSSSCFVHLLSKSLFSYSNSSKTTIFKKLCKSKILLYCISAGRKNPLQVTLDHFRPVTLWFDEFLLHRVAGRKWSRVICKGFFRPATVIWLSFDKFFNSVRKFGMESFRLSWKWVLRLPILLNFDIWSIGKPPMDSQWSRNSHR